MWKRYLEQARDRKRSYPKVDYDPQFEARVMCEISEGMRLFDYLVPVVSLCLALMVFSDLWEGDSLFEDFRLRSESEILAFSVPYDY